MPKRRKGGADAGGSTVGSGSVRLEDIWPPGVRARPREDGKSGIPKMDRYTRARRRAAHVRKLEQRQMLLADPSSTVETPCDKGE
jgi:hypothetical protein